MTIFVHQLLLYIFLFFLCFVFCAAQQGNCRIIKERDAFVLTIICILVARNNVIFYISILYFIFVILQFSLFAVLCAEIILMHLFFFLIELNMHNNQHEAYQNLQLLVKFKLM